MNANTDRGTQAGESASGEGVHEYPTCERLAAVGDEYRTVHEFIDWLGEQGIHLASWEDVGLKDKWLQPIHEQHEQTVLRFLDIDPKALEQERRAMLAAL